MIADRNVNIIMDAEGKKLVLINDIRFKGKRNIDWKNELVKEFPESKSRMALVGASAKAKANSATAIPELIKIASNPKWEENREIKHNKDAKYGWYRYDVRFALPVYEEEVLVRYNVYRGQLLINHAENGNKYLYDILAIKKETRNPQQ